MRIGVDCHVLSGLYQGSRTYLLNLYAAVVAANTSHQFVFYGDFNGEMPFGKEVEYRKFPSDSRWRRLTYQANSVVKIDRLDLYHTTYIAPLFLSCRSLVTVHDVLFESVPQYFSRAFVLRSRYLVRRSVCKASQVHTISEFSRNMIVERYAVPRQAVRLVPAGIDLRRFNCDHKDEARRLISSKYGLENYLLTVGRLEPRKNHAGLVEAFARVKDSLRKLGPLVIIGQPDFRYQLFLKRISELGLENDVRVLSSVPDSDLPSFYRAARTFIYPSFAEGFGIPVLEAMACGTPVITSERTAIPEIVGDGGLLIDPHSIENISQAIERLGEDPQLAEALSRDGAEIAKNWSWEHAAQKYAAALAEME